jgi:hypothetical protein
MKTDAQINNVTFCHADKSQVINYRILHTCLGLPPDIQEPAVHEAMTGPVIEPKLGRQNEDAVLISLTKRLV